MRTSNGHAGHGLAAHAAQPVWALLAVLLACCLPRGRDASPNHALHRIIAARSAEKHQVHDAGGTGADVGAGGGSGNWTTSSCLWSIEQQRCLPSYAQLFMQDGTVPADFSSQ